jgi:hypothetical protein
VRSPPAGSAGPSAGPPGAGRRAPRRLLPSRPLRSPGAVRRRLEASPSLVYGAGLLIPLGRSRPSRVRIPQPPRNRSHTCAGSSVRIEHLTTDQAAGGSNPSQRANGPLRPCSGPNSWELPFASAAPSGTSSKSSSPLSTAADALSSPRFATIRSVRVRTPDHWACPRFGHAFGAMANPFVAHRLVEGLDSDVVTDGRPGPPAARWRPWL